MLSLLLLSLQPPASSLKLQPPALSLQLSASSLEQRCLSLTLGLVKANRRSKHPQVLSGQRSGALTFQTAPETALDLARPPSASPARVHRSTEKTRLDRKMPQPESHHPSLFQSSQGTVKELQASPDFLRPPGTQLDSSWSHLETNRPDHQKVGASRWAVLAILKLS